MVFRIFTHGTAVVTSGEVEYMPTTGDPGLDTFQYSVQGNLGTTSNVAPVSIEVTSPPSRGGGGGSVSLLDLAVVVSFALIVSRRPHSANLGHAKKSAAVVTKRLHGRNIRLRD